MMPIVFCASLVPCPRLYAAADRPDNFYMLGSMGLASSVGLGLAFSQTRRVYSIEGDGSLLMNLGSLATVAHHAPENFCLVILNNKVYGRTGNQPTHTASGTDLAALASAAGNQAVAAVRTIAELRRALDERPGRSVVIIAEVEPGNAPVPVIPLAPIEIKSRFMNALHKP